MLRVLASPSKCFALRAELNGKYLQSVNRKKAGASPIEASGGTVVPNADTVVGSARARFLVQPSEEGGGLVHVRCCYNNKYWVPVKVQESSGCSRWSIGTANEPEEDLSSPSCTLFQPIPVKDKDDSIRFLHSGLHKFARVVSIGDKTYLQLDDGDDQENNSDSFTVVGLPQNKELPKHVAFKGENGRYLRAKPLNTANTVGLITLQVIAPITLLPTAKIIFSKYPQFHTKNMRDARTIFTTCTNDDGTVRIKSNTGAFWRRESNNLISAPLAQRDDNDPDSLFEVVTGVGFVALRNLGNNKFCRSLAGVYTVLGACEDSLSQWAKLKLEEPVDSREISDVKFHLDEARIYNKKILNAVTITRTNNTSRENKATFSFTKKVEMVSTWVTSVSSKIGVTTKINFGSSGTPIISGGQVTTCAQTTTSEGQQTSESTTDEAMITEEYYIPPRTKVAAKFVAMRASCDVPYSYKQTDVLTTGEEVTTIHDDGIYTVANNYNFHITVTDDKDEIRKIEG